MRRTRIAGWLLLAVVLGAFYLTLRSLGVWGVPVLAKVKAVPKGDQEIAWIHAATSGAAWERFVAGVHQVRLQRPDLQVDDGQAFPDQTAAVPELALSVAGSEARLWIRWYKLTSEIGTEQWVKELANRNPPPLAMIGGGTSDRARDLAKALNSQPHWHGSPPLLLITTATADRVRLEERQDPIATPDQVDLANEPSLMGIYPNRSFRFCFTNSQMAEAVVDFVWSRPDLRPLGSPTVPAAAVAQGGAGGMWGILTWLSAGIQLQPPSVHALRWIDDPYSIDLSEQFRQVFQRPGRQPSSINMDSVSHSIGGYYRPNSPEATAAQRLLTEMARFPAQRSVLVLPTVAQPARRFLRTLTAAAPLAVRNVVVVTGDSIPFNTVYRDRNIAWNIQDMPVPLVFFCHENPVDWPREESPRKQTSAEEPAHASATDDVLLNADIVHILLEAVAPEENDGENQRPLLSSSDELARRLHARQPPFFHQDGNRLGGSGEYVVCLRPHIEGERVLSTATIEVWTRQKENEFLSWKLVWFQEIDYDASSGEG